MGFEDGLIGEMGHPSNSSTLSPFGDSRALSPGNKQKPVWAKLCAEGDCAYAKDKFLDAAQHYTDSLALMLGLQDKVARSLLLVRRSAAFSMAGKHAQALWDAELAIQEGGQAPPAGALLVRATSLIQRGDSQGASRDLAACLAAAVDWPVDGAQTRISAVRSSLDKDAGRSIAIVRLLQSGSAAVRDWLLWQVVPIVVFALAWLGFCAFCFTVLVSSGELGVDQWRAKLMTTVGVVAASVFWVSFVTEDQRKGKVSVQRGGKKHVTMREWASRLVIAVKVFGFRKAMRLAASYFGLLGGAGKNVDSLESDVHEVQRLLASQGKEKIGKSGGVAQAEAVALDGRGSGEVEGTLSTESSKVFEDGGKKKVDANDADVPTRAGSFCGGGFGARGKDRDSETEEWEKEEKEGDLDGPAPIAPAVQGGKRLKSLKNDGGAGDDGKEVMVTTIGDCVADDNDVDHHQECGVVGEDEPMSLQSGCPKAGEVPSPEAQGEGKTPGDVVVEGEKPGDVVVEGEKPRDAVQELSESLKAQNHELEAIKEVLAAQVWRERDEIIKEARLKGASMSVTDDDIADSGDRRYESNLSKDAGNAAYAKANSMSGASRGRKLAEALELYTRAHEVDPDNVPVLTNRAAVYMALGKNEKAVCDCELAVATGKIVMAEAKIVARAYERKGKAEVLLGKYGEAAVSFEGALEFGGAVEELLEDAKVKVEEERREKEEKRKQEEHVAAERAAAQRKAEEERIESIAAEHRAEEERVAVERKRKEEERVAIEEMTKAEEERIAVEKKNEEELKKRIALEKKKKKEEEDEEKKKKAGEERIAVEKKKALDKKKAEEDKSAEDSRIGSKPSKGESNGSTKDPVMQEIATPVSKPLEMTTLQKFAEAERIKEKGNSSFREGNFPAAKAFYLDALSKVVRLVSNDDAPKESRQTLVACHLNISVCFLKVGDAENALLHSSQVVRIDPDNPKVLYRHASALVGVGQLQEARQSLIKAAAVKPGDASIEGLLREVDAKLGMLAEEAHLTAKKPTRVGDGPASASSGGDAPLGDKVDAPTGEGNDVRSGAVRDAGGGDGATQTCVSLATKMKKDGNDLFKKGMYAAAMEEYRDAIEMLTRPGVDKVMVKELLAQCRNNAAASAVKSSSGLRREKEAAEVLEAAVAMCTDVVDAAQELSETCREAQLAKALFRRGQALAEASGLEESARAGLKHLDGSLMDRACKDLNLALEMCPGDGAIQAALVDAQADKAGERRRKYRDEKRAAAAADEGAGKKEGGGEEGRGGGGLKGFDDWDRIDYEKECEKIDDEALRESGMTDEEITNKKILEIVQSEGMDEDEKMAKCMALVGHADWKPKPLTEEEQKRRENDKFLKFMQDPRRSAEERMAYLATNVTKVASTPGGGSFPAPVPGTADSA